MKHENRSALKMHVRQNDVFRPVKEDVFDPACGLKGLFETGEK